MTGENPKALLDSFLERQKKVDELIDKYWSRMEESITYIDASVEENALDKAIRKMSKAWKDYKRAQAARRRRTMIDLTYEDSS